MDRKSKRNDIDKSRLQFVGGREPSFRFCTCCGGEISSAMIDMRQMDPRESTFCVKASSIHAKGL